ncbi:MAG: hypothetical protein WBA23_17995, partial [Tunicatimonas sp.]|uniref:hypothetical protein n=1 Tax=Tunicatimonas sp. TaxID=1940096 RepID=UPI003C733467
MPVVLILGLVPVCIVAFPGLRSGSILLVLSLLQIALLGWISLLLKHVIFVPLKLGNQFLSDNKLKQFADPRLLALYQENDRLKKEIHRASEYVKAIEDHDKDISAIYAEQDQHSQLKESLTGLQAHLQKLELEEKQRNWVTQGLAKFGDILRANT